MLFSGLSSPKLIEVAVSSALSRAMDRSRAYCRAARSIGADADGVASGGARRICPSAADRLRDGDAADGGRLQWRDDRSGAHAGGSGAGGAMAKYPPQGIRGLFLSTVESHYGKVDAGTHIASANRDRWISIQIETTEAVEIAEEIAATEGVDWLFVGPADLSWRWGARAIYASKMCCGTGARIGCL